MVQASIQQPTKREVRELVDDIEREGRQHNRDVLRKGRQALPLMRVVRGFVSEDGKYTVANVHGEGDTFVAYRRKRAWENLGGLLPRETKIDRKLMNWELIRQYREKGKVTVNMRETVDGARQSLNLIRQSRQGKK